MINTPTYEMMEPISGALASRLTEVGMDTNAVKVICFGVCDNTRIIARAFRKREHVLVIYGQTAYVVPPHHTLKSVLERTELYAKRQ